MDTVVSVPISPSTSQFTVNLSEVPEHWSTTPAKLLHVYIPSEHVFIAVDSVKVTRTLSFIGVHVGVKSSENEEKL